MELKIEEAFEKIEETIGKLEDETISLDEAFAVYQEGMKLLKQCDEKIDRVEKNVLAVNQEGELDEF
ncbi:exodeoxyribonuclease VII small subunit [bacterium C-53]|nr:exodeoxyribonuclease VII small subunit [Lachnospiraceae bacterium]NBI04671.1 exodeoxyribonuclease VII small subunit [Lachnospiraceae bacterium]RKJ07894.1 exodeoxyribonuclease VII small subunit [bacterium C-53]